MKHIVISKNFINVVIIAISLLGLYFCFTGGYGSDEDTLPMMYVFEQRLGTGNFATSRFTSFPVAEMGIGFLAYFFGSWAANLFTFTFLILGLYFFYLSLEIKKEIKNINIFFLLTLTSPILFFDNLEPVDYSWSFFFFSLGLYFFSRKKNELAILFFAFSVGVRINYILFVLIAIFYFDTTYTIKKKLEIFIITFIFSGMFYVPIWYENALTLNWLTAARPTDQGLIGILARFFYKSYFAIGTISFFIIFWHFIKRIKEIKKINNINFLALLIFANLLIFLWIPAEFSYIQLFLVVMFFIVLKSKNFTFIYLIVFLNLLSWIFVINPIEVKHIDSSMCGEKNAKSANINIQIEEGFFMRYVNSRQMIKCRIDNNSERGRRILKGKSTRIKN